MRFVLRENAFAGYVRSYRAVIHYHDPYLLVQDARNPIYNLLNSGLILRLRLVICLFLQFVKTIESGEEIVQNFYFCSRAQRVISRHQIREAIDSCFAHLLISIDNFIHNGSGWNIKEIVFIDVNIARYRGFRGGGGKIVELPNRIKNKKAVLNIKCLDKYCFLYCIAAKLYPAKNNANRPSKYKKFLKEFNIRNLKFPVGESEIKIFEKNNNVKIFVYGYEENLKVVYPIYFSKQNDRENFAEVDLLFFKNHYFLIRRFNALMNYNKSINYFCKRCLTGFARQKILARHQTLCINHKPQAVTVPDNLIVKFSDVSKMVEHPFCVFADFEALTRKISVALPDPKNTYSEPIEMHEAVSYAIVVIDEANSIYFHEYYCGLDAVEQFLITLKSVSEKLLERMHVNESPIESDRCYYDADICHICHKKFKEKDIKCVDHNHISGVIRGFAHQACNINFRNRYFIPVVIHNAKNYDTHFIIKKITKKFANNIKMIPCSIEKFQMFTLDSLRFIDSFQFLSTSLEKLVENLINSNHAFEIFNCFYKDHEKTRHLLKRKGIFPYSFFDRIEKLNLPHLPSREKFFNVLTNKPISAEDYEHAKKVYKTFDCKNLGEYLELYQNLDVVLLAEVFQSFRRMSLQNFELDPVHFITSAQLTWNAGLKLTRIELTLLKSVDEYLWFENQIRGGICYLNKRYAAANNIYVPQLYDANKTRNYILPLDVCNLYGFCMTGFLPEGNFAWLSEREIKNFDVFRYNEKSKSGFIIECDLDYPTKIHDLTGSFPLAPEHLLISYENLSPYSKKLCDQFGLKHMLPSKKLTPNCYPKKNYVTHYLNLQMYLKMGMKISKVHRILSFSQSPWLRPYIELLHKKRITSKDEFSKEFYKKMINSFFGRLMLNVRKKTKIVGALDEKTCDKYLRSPLLEHFEPINESFALFKMHIPNLVLDKPIYAGFCILELSKLRMYDLYYSHFKKFYRNDCCLLYIDTDSLYLSISTRGDIYSELKEKFGEILDLSNFNPHHTAYSADNKNKLGVLKFEYTEPVAEFVGLKAKQYAFAYGQNVKKRAKGISKNVVDTFNFKMYKDTLNEQKSSKEIQKNIMSKHHVLFTMEQRRRGLCAYYDKAHVAADGINVLPYGHYKIFLKKGDMDP